MGRLIEGKWSTEWYSTDEKGEFQRKATSFHDSIEAEGRFAPEAGRYHLYVSYACPWAHRTLIYRKLKGLEDAISISVVHPFMGDDGWSFEAGEGVVPDPISGAKFLRDVYVRAKPDYTGRVTVPVLWDKETSTIVNNESSEIIRMMNGPLSTLSATKAQAELDLYPKAHRAEIDRLNEVIYETVNNGVYRAGFATSQEAYGRAFDSLFQTLDMLEGLLAERPYLTGDVVTEADWRLFPTLLRFDPVYVGHFKCNLRPIGDYPNLRRLVRELYRTPGVAETCNLDHIKDHYYQSHPTVNPTRIVPKGPSLDWLLND